MSLHQCLLSEQINGYFGRKCLLFFWGEGVSGDLKVCTVNVLKGIIFMESTFYNFLNFALFSVHYCYSAVLFLFINQDYLSKVTVIIAFLELDMCTENRRK